LGERLRHCQQAGTAVVVDLEQVEFMDAAGLRVLVGASESSDPGRFSVTPGSPQVQRLFELTGITTVLHVVAPVHGADRDAA
jgi:anti-sigma B factor antagonist